MIKGGLNIEGCEIVGLYTVHTYVLVQVAKQVCQQTYKKIKLAESHGQNNYKRLLRGAYNYANS